MNHPKPRPKRNRSRDGTTGRPLTGRQRWWLGVLLAVYWVVMFVATHVPGSQLDALPAGSDKWAHLVGYFGLGLLLGMSVAAKRELTPGGIAVLVAILCVYAAVDELSQIPIPGRSADQNDFTLDVVGLLLGIVLSESSLAVAGRLLRRNRSD